MKEDVTVKIVKVVWCAERVETTRKKTKDEVRGMAEARWLKAQLRRLNFSERQ